MSTDRFQLIAVRLLRGNFINRAVDPELFDYLEEPANVDGLNDFLGRLGLRALRTGNGETWFAALRRLDESNRNAARETAAQAKRELRHWVSFLKLTMSALNEPAPVAGALLHAHRLNQAIHENLNLQETLRTLAQRLRSTNDASLQKMLELVINWALREDQGLLELIDEDKGIYRLTGKVDWVLDMILAIDEAKERETPPTPQASVQTGALFPVSKEGG
jgi:arsenate reductase-like glutaredoxin family protein